MEFIRDGVGMNRGDRSGSGQLDQSLDDLCRVVVHSTVFHQAIHIDIFIMITGKSGGDAGRTRALQYFLDDRTAVVAGATVLQAHILVYISGDHCPG